MNKQPNNDITRCYGHGCHIRDNCQRFLTIAIDKEGVYSYVHSLSNHEIEKECDSFFEDKVNKDQQNALDITKLKLLNKQHKEARHSKEAQHAGDQAMLMMDAIIARLEAK